MEQPAKESPRGPGRPAKFGRPSQVVAFTLPNDTIDRLRRVHRDLGWAIVKLLDTRSAPRSTRQDVQPDVELVTVGNRRALIVVNQLAIRNLPGVNIIPLDGTRAFLALDVDRGMSDLALAVNDRLADMMVEQQERQALAKLQAQLRAWRRDQTLRFHTRAIIVVERFAKTSSRREDAGAAAHRRTAKAVKNRFCV
jgi:hypothetical protein